METFKINRSKIGLTRKDLIEGRLTGEAHAMCANENGEIVLLHELTTCKDYFNDAVFKLDQGKDIQVYGFNTNIIPMSLNDSDFGYMLIGYFKESDSIKSYLTLEQAQKIVKELNAIEKYMELSPTTLYKTDQKNEFLIVFDKFWLQTVYISLYTLLHRAALRTDDLLGKILDESLILRDIQLTPATSSKLLSLINKESIENPLTVDSDIYTIHNYGFISHVQTTI